MEGRAFGWIQLFLGGVLALLGVEAWTMFGPNPWAAVVIALALFWPACAVAIVGLAYVTRNQDIFGKFDDGSLPTLRTTALLPYHVVAYVAWGITCASREAPYHEVAPNLFVGRRPSRDGLPTKLGHLVDLTAEFKRVSVPPGVRYHLLATLDTMEPEERASFALARTLAGSPDPIFVHCAAGHGRSATFAALVLVARGLTANAAEAESLMQQTRAGVRLRASQRKLVDRFASDLRASSQGHEHTA